MLKKLLIIAVAFLFTLTLVTPSTVYAVDDIPEEDLLFYTEPNDDTPVTDEDLMYTTEEPETTYDYENYDWEKAWDSLDNTDTVSDLSDEEAAALGILGAMFTGIFLLITIVVSVATYIYFALTLMVTAKKLNVPNAWLAWIPIANLLIVVQTAGVSNWGILWLLIPGVNLVYGVYVYMMIAKRRGFESWLGLLILIPFVNMILPGYIAWAEPKKAQTEKPSV